MSASHHPQTRERFAHLPSVITRTFADGTFVFYVAEFGLAFRDARVVFRVREDRDPLERAREKGLRGFDRLVPARPEHVEAWLRSHSNYRGGPVMATTTMQTPATDHRA